MSAAPPPEPPGAGRRSYAIERFAASISGQGRLHIFDFGGANQANIDFLTSSGHRVYCEDLLVSVDYFFSQAERDSAPAADRIESFLAQGYRFRDQTAGGVLLWDTLQFIPPGLAEAFVQRLYRLLIPDACLLALFSPEGAAGACRPLRCRIQDAHTVLMEPRVESRPMLCPFTNRAIEKLFSRFAEVKFFLTRENVREVIVRR